MNTLKRLRYWLLPLMLLSQSAIAAVCDVDADNDIDRDDILLISQARNQPANSPDDPRDGNKDGLIDNRDVGFCSKKCTLPRCVSPSANQTPIANAGADQKARVGDTVLLNGSGSVDPDGDVLTFVWQFTAMPAGSAASLNDAQSSQPGFVLDVAGAYQLQLIVNDGKADSAADTVSITTENSPPVASAGPDGSVPVGQQYLLNGAASYDVDGDSISYFWQILLAPPGSIANLTAVDTLNPRLTPDVSGNYLIQLIVNDGEADSLPDQVQISTENSAPVADAGADQTPAVNDWVMLDGSASSDIDGDPLTYVWRLLSKPDQSDTELEQQYTMMPQLLIDQPGSYIVGLTVSDGLLSSSEDLVELNTRNSAPLANAGNNQTAVVGTLVMLDGSASSDIDGDPLSYNWSLLSKPAGSSAELSNASTVMPDFSIDLAGTYQFQLIVNDGLVDSLPATVSVSTENSAPVANAGPDQNPVVGDTVQLDGSASYDIDGDALNYRWSVVSLPNGSSAVLSDTASAQPGLNIDVAGTYLVQLIVNDGNQDSAPDVMRLDTRNSKPVANAGADQRLDVDSLVLLDGSASYDADGDSLNFAWAITAKPLGSSATLNDPVIVNPQFMLDMPGEYTLQLVVNDGATSSDPDTVIISTNNIRPLANAGPDQTGQVGSSLTLDGSASSDADGDALSYSWSVSSKPSGSNATLSQPQNVSTDITLDSAGSYVVQLIVNDGLLNSQPDTVVLQTENQPPLADAGADQAAQTGDVVQFNGSNSSDPDGDALTFNWAITEAPQGSLAQLENMASAQPSLVPDIAGLYRLSLTVSDGTLDSEADSVELTVSEPLPALTMNLSSPRVGVGRSISGTLTLAGAAPQGGVTVALSSDDNAIVSVNPLSVVIAEGATSASFNVSGTGSGNTTINAMAEGYQQATAAIYATTALISLGDPGNLAPGMVSSLALSLSEPAPAGGVLVSLSSSNDDVVAVTASVFIAEGQSTGATNPQLTADQLGSATVFASADNYGPDERELNVTLTMNFTPANISVVETLTKTAFLNLSAPAPSGGLTVNLSSSDSSIASVPASAFVPEGQLSAQVTVAAVAQGNAQITASPLAGVEASLGVTVTPAPAINANNLTIGKDLQNATSIWLGDTPTQPTTVTIEIADPAVAIVSTSATTVGSAVASLSNIISNSLPQVYIQGLQQGETTYTVSAPGFAPVTRTINVWPSGFVEYYYSQSQLNSTTFSANIGLSVRSAMLYPDDASYADIYWNTPSAYQAVRGGYTVQVAVTSSNPSVGVISESPLTFNGGQGNVETQFDPVSAGEAVISVGQPAGFSGAAAGGGGRRGSQVNVVITAPDISFSNNQAVGKNLQTSRQVYLESAPPSPVDILVCSSDSNTLLLSKAANTVGGSCITLESVSSTNAGQIWLQGIEQGAATLSATANSYNTASVAVNVWPSGFVEYYYSQSQLNSTTFSANIGLSVRSAMLYPDDAGYAEIYWNTPFAYQALRAGLTVEVPVTSSNPSVGVITESPLIFIGGQGSVETQFDPESAGEVVISVGQPAGFSGAAAGGGGRRGSQVNVVITAPDININAPLLGKDLINSTSVYLDAAPPAPVDVQVCSSAGTVILLSKASTDIGSNCVTFEDVSSTNVGTLYVHGINQGSAQLQASAAGYNNGNTTVEVWPSGFGFWNTNYSASVANGSDNAVRIGAYILYPATLNYYSSLPLRPGVEVDVNFTSSDPAVGEQSAPLRFVPGSHYLNASFNAKQPGEVTLSIQTPAGFSTPNNYRFATMQVNP